MKYVLFMCRTLKILISNWPRTRKFSQLLQAGKTVAFDFSRVGHAPSPTFMLWLVKVWRVSSCGKFMHDLESCLLWQLKLREFCVNLWCFYNCLFPLYVQNKFQLLWGVLCYSWLVCSLGFWLRNTSLVKVGNPISDGIVFVFTLLNA